MDIKRVRVPVVVTPGVRSIQIDDGATNGAILGVNFRLPDGTVLRVDQVVNPAAEEPEYAVTLWRLIGEIPPNVVALAETDTQGIYVVTGPGTSETRTLEVGDLLAISNPSGVLGNPKITRTSLRQIQAAPLATWIVNHNLGRRVNAEAYTVGGARVWADILHTSDNQVQINFDSPMAGYALID